MKKLCTLILLAIMLSIPTGMVAQYSHTVLLNVGEEFEYQLPYDIKSKNKTGGGWTTNFPSNVEILNGTDESIKIKILKYTSVTVLVQYDCIYNILSEGRWIYGGRITFDLNVNIRKSDDPNPDPDPDPNPDPNPIKYGDVFTSQTPEGVTMTFKVINTTNKYCLVGKGIGQTEPAIDKSTKGTVTIPEVVSGTTTTGISVQNFTVVTIGVNAFNECSEINTVKMPNSIEVIEARAFHGCSGLKSVNLSTSLKTLENSAFSGSSIPSIVIPSSLRSIDAEAFSCCPNLYSLSVEKSNPYYDSRDNCNAIIEKSTNKLTVGCLGTVIPGTVKIIGTKAFAWLGNLDSFTIPNSVEIVEESAFMNARIKEITLPNSLKTIKENAFSSSDIKAVISLMKNPPAISSDVFVQWASTGKKIATLYVPKGCRSIYASTSGWENFNIIEEGSVVVSKISLLTSAGTDISNKSLSLFVNEEERLSAVVSPDNATDKSVSWASSDNNVASVNNSGIVTGKSEGSVRITCTANDGSGVSSSTLIIVRAQPDLPTLKLLSLVSTKII